jgi:hypothetical protein
MAILKKLAIITAILLICNSCKLLSRDRDYKFPDRGFKLTASDSIHQLLDTDTYYFKTKTIDPLLQQNNGKISISVMKFYPDGRLVFDQFVDDFPTNGDIDLAATERNVHYYSIEDGILKMEYYIDAMLGMTVWKGKIYDDRLVFYEFDPGRGDSLTYYKR